MLPAWDSRFELKPGVWVFIPNKKSIDDGRAIKYAVGKAWTPPKNYFHLHAGGHVKALESHLENKIFVHLDIKNFFGSINRTRVTRCLKGLFSYSEARYIAGLSTVIHPTDKYLMLPFGFVQSPILASLCLAKSALGHCIRLLPKKYPGLVISVYVDDIILSSNDESMLHNATSEIKQAATRAALELNPTKEEGPAPKITAFNIELSNGNLEISTERFQQFVLAFSQSENLFERAGIHSYVTSINSTQADAMGTP